MSEEKLFLVREQDLKPADENIYVPVNKDKVIERLDEKIADYDMLVKGGHGYQVNVYEAKREEAMSIRKLLREQNA